MKKKVCKLTIFILVLALVFISAGCGDKAEVETDLHIKIGATATPHVEILNAAKPILEKQGYTLEIIEYVDYDGMNSAVNEGTLDANYFQHITYLNEKNLLNGTSLVNAGAVHFEPLALYSTTLESLDDLEEGMTIALPSDDTNEARALRLLETEGLIKLKEEADVLATIKDIETNKMNLKFIEMKGENLIEELSSADASVINGNYAIEAELDFSKALLVEGEESMLIESYANVIAVKEGKETLPKIEALYAALTDEKVKEFIEEEYKGAVVALF